MSDNSVESLNEADPQAAPLLPALRQWRAATALQTQPADTERLLAVLQPALAAQTRSRRRSAAAWPWLLLRAQLRVVHREIWLASGLVMIVGILVTLVTFDLPGNQSALPFVMLAPLVAAMGAAFLFGLDDQTSLEVELATATPPRLVLLARLALLFAFNLALGIAGSLLLSLVHAQLALWPLVQAWLAPMACLSALAFLLSVLFVDATAAAIVSLAVWGLQVLRRAGAGGILPLIIRAIPDLFVPSAQGWLWLTALALVGLTVWLGGKEERWMKRTAA